MTKAIRNIKEEEEELISVIIPLYNTEKYIEQCIESVLNQTYTNIEVIVVNDKSTDSSLDVVSKYSANNKVVIFSNEVNVGVSATRNFGIKKSKGKFIAFLDADDYWHVDKLRLQINKIKETGADVCSCSFSMVLDNGVIERVLKVSPKITADDMLKNKTGIGMSMALCKKDIFELVQFRDFYISEDYLFWIELFNKKKNLLVVGVQETVSFYRIVENSRSSNNLKKVLYGQWDIILNYSGVSFIQAVYYYLFYILSIIKWKLKLT